MRKLLLSVFAILATSQQGLAESDEKTFQTTKISRAKYIAGGIVGTLPLPIGGLGHAIQGRWKSDWGWAHTAAQAGLWIGVGAGGAAMFYLDSKDDEMKEKGAFSMAPLVPLSMGVLLYLPLKALEAIGVWRVDKKKYEIVGNKRQPLLIAPIFKREGAGLLVAASL